MRTDNDPALDPEIIELLEDLGRSPEAIQALMEMLEYFAAMQDAHMDKLSAQQPAEYDCPNMGGNYSMLNAPTNSSIPPSVAYQPLS